MEPLPTSMEAPNEHLDLEEIFGRLTLDTPPIIENEAPIPPSTSLQLPVTHEDGLEVDEGPLTGESTTLMSEKTSLVTRAHMQSHAGASTTLMSEKTSSLVTLVHEARMQSHAPGVELQCGFQELPRRIVAIESVLRGHAFDSFLPLDSADAAVMADKARQYAWGESSPIRGDRNPRSVSSQAKKRSAAPAPLFELLEESSSTPDGSSWQPTTCAEATGESLWAQCHIVTAPLASLEWLRLVHSESHLRNLIRKTLVARIGQVSFQDKEDADLYFNANTLLAARLACGGAVAAVQSLFQTPLNSAPLNSAPLNSAPLNSAPRSAFAIVRPPGHHCAAEQPAGFCFFSNVAVAARFARESMGLERVAIFDSDIHPGDGTQSIFYEDSSVLTISLHVAARVRDFDDIDDRTEKIVPRVVWPFRADKGLEYAGVGSGRGFNVNIPWPNEYVDDCDYEEAMVRPFSLFCSQSSC